MVMTMDAPRQDDGDGGDDEKPTLESLAADLAELKDALAEHVSGCTCGGDRLSSALRRPGQSDHLDVLLLAGPPNKTSKN